MNIPCVHGIHTSDKADVTDLASAKVFLKKVAAVLCVLSKEL